MSALDVKAIARSLGGDAHAGYALVPGPGHGAADRSLKVKASSDAPGGFVVFSFAGDPWQDCRNYVMEKLGVEPPTVEAGADRERSDEERTAAAMRYYDKSRDPKPGCPMLIYLDRRGVLDVLPEGVIGSTLRWYARTGCMVALVRHNVTGRPVAIHRTFIDASGMKTDRKMFGPCASASIRLSADPLTVPATLAIGEGIESSLSIVKLGLAGSVAWACMSAGGLERFPLLDPVETLVIGQDGDFTGAIAAAVVRDRYAKAGRTARIARAGAVGRDLNDVVMGRTGGEIIQ